jgi:hypothetical protein
MISMNKTLDMEKIIWMDEQNNYAKVPMIKGK